MLAKWTYLLPIFFARWLARKHCMCTLFQGAEWVHGPDGTLFARYKGTKQDVQPSLSALWLAFLHCSLQGRSLSEKQSTPFEGEYVSGLVLLACFPM